MLVEPGRTSTASKPTLEVTLSPDPHVNEPPEPDIPLAAAPTAKNETSPPSVPAPPPAQVDVHVSEHPVAPSPEPMPMYEALRVLVMIRLQRDSQTQEERVDPILMDNLSKVEPVTVSTNTPDTLMREMTRDGKLRAREEAYKTTEPSLQIRFAQRQVELDEKVQRLRAEYLALHEQWLVHCGKLDDVAKGLALQEAAATAGRTTRRSLATMGDAVRSDLEMEQIIASLGTERY